jgi:hypothetical protein
MKFQGESKLWSIVRDWARYQDILTSAFIHRSSLHLVLFEAENTMPLGVHCSEAVIFE